MSQTSSDVYAGLRSMRDLRTASRRRETTHVFVRETLRVAILNGELPGGTRLVQSDLATELEVSTTPIREALRDLASEGLIRIDPHRGGVVCELDQDDMEEVYLIRQRLETLALELAVPNYGDDVLTAARDLHVEMSAAPDSAAWVELNREFHMTLYDPCDKPRLLATIRTLQDASVMVVSTLLQTNPAIRRNANVEHGLILDALDRGDLEEATATVLEHLSVSLKALQAEAAAKHA